MRAATVFLLVISLLAVSAIGYIIYSNAPGEMHALVPVVPADVEQPQRPSDQASDQSQQFYPNMRFRSSKITYYIESACNDNKKTQVRAAMDYFEDKTSLTFDLVSRDDAELTITCSQLAPEPQIKNHFVAGEGGPTEVLNTSVYAVILSGKISLYRDERCSQPTIGLHELLHVLGFDHNTDPGSILYPTLDCDQKVDDYLIDKINKLYSVPTSSDLSFVSANASKSGPYLNFAVEMINQGLASADKVKLVVQADGQTVKEFYLDNLEIGTKKTLTVENLKIPRSATRVTFVLDPDHQISELSESNNQFELMISN